MNTTLSDLYAALDTQGITNTSARIDFLTEFFIGKPYIVNPQGEGDTGEIDQAPLYRFDGFDCVTYVNNILALALADDAFSFQEKLLAINYYHSMPTFENRFHFMSVDWNIQNQKNHIVIDVTEKIIDDNKAPIALFSEGEIDRAGFFLKRTEKETSTRAERLKQIAASAKNEYARLPYLSLSTFFDENKNAHDYYFNQIPHASIIEIVRPNWHLKEIIGTNLHISHVGFSIRHPSGELFFRHASSEQKCVVEVLLSDYLKNYLDSPTIKGINVQMIL